MPNNNLDLLTQEGEFNIIWTQETIDDNFNQVTVPASLLKYDRQYILRIKSNLEPNSFKVIPFRTMVDPNPPEEEPEEPEELEKEPSTIEEVLKWLTKYHTIDIGRNVFNAEVGVNLITTILTYAEVFIDRNCMQFDRYMPDYYSKMPGTQRLYYPPKQYYLNDDRFIFKTEEEEASVWVLAKESGLVFWSLPGEVDWERKVYYKDWYGLLQTVSNKEGGTGVKPSAYVDYIVFMYGKFRDTVKNYMPFFSVNNFDFVTGRVDETDEGTVNVPLFLLHYNGKVGYLDWKAKMQQLLEFYKQGILPNYGSGGKEDSENSKEDSENSEEESENNPLAAASTAYQLLTRVLTKLKKYHISQIPKTKAGMEMAQNGIMGIFQSMPDSSVMESLYPGSDHRGESAATLITRDKNPTAYDNVLIGQVLPLLNSLSETYPGFGFVSGRTDPNPSGGVYEIPNILISTTNMGEWQQLLSVTIFLINTWVHEQEVGAVQHIPDEQLNEIMKEIG